MSLDGFSMANVSLNNELTAAQAAGNAEHLAMKESEIKIKNMRNMVYEAAWLYDHGKSIRLESALCKR